MNNRPRVLLAVPASNEEKMLEGTISTIMKFFKSTRGEFRWQLAISVNGSTDGTLEIAKRASRAFPNVTVIRTPHAGKGLAIRKAWECRNADVYAFTDADLAADIELLPALVRGVIEGNDICAASRRLPGARVNRPTLDRLTSLALNALVKRLCHSRLTDTSCGLKAVSPRVVRELVPLVHNNTWTFDTELLLIAKRQGVRIREVPARWREPRSNEVFRKARAVLVVADYLTSLLRHRRHFASRLSEDGGTCPLHRSPTSRPWSAWISLSLP